MAAIADAGPRIITFVVDGVLCDGGQHRQYGWGRWRGELGTVVDAGQIAVDPSVESLRIYDRYLRTSEAIGNFHHGVPEPSTLAMLATGLLALLFYAWQKRK